MSTQKIHVYFMPGMAASSRIFEHICLPEDRFECHFLEWHVPEQGCSLQHYARQMADQIDHENPVLIGVSFGGMLVQEMARLIDVAKVIIISSVKARSEMPRRLQLAGRTKFHKLLPTSLVSNVEFLAKYAMGDPISKRLELYELYLAMRDKRYIDWALDQIVNWEPTEIPEQVVHIHGDKDAVFPIKHIEKYIKVPNGTHTMIIHRYKWFNERLPAIILEDGSSI